MFKLPLILKLLLCFAMFSFAPPDDGGGDGGEGGDGKGGDGKAGDGKGGAGDGQPGKFHEYIDPATGAFKPGWSKPFGLPDTLEKKFTSPEAVLKSYVQLEKFNGSQNKVVLPTAESTAEDRAAFFGKLGRPDKPEGYELKMPEKIGDKPFPKELWRAEEATAFQAFAHKLNLTKEQAQAIAAYDAERGLKGLEYAQMSEKQAREKAESDLKAAWGTKYTENLAVANKATSQLWKAGEEPAHLANDPSFAQAMFKVGQMISEEPAAGARGASHAATDPQTEINTIKADKSHPYHIKGHPNHDAAVRHVASLYEQKGAGKK